MSARYPSKQELPYHSSREHYSSSPRSSGNATGNGHASRSSTAQRSSYPRNVTTDEQIAAPERSHRGVIHENARNGRSAREDSSVGSSRPQKGRASDAQFPHGGNTSNGQSTRKDTNVSSSKMSGNSMSTPKQGEWDERSPGSPPSSKHSTKHIRDISKAEKTTLGSESEILDG